MEAMFWRFPHIGEQIVGLLEDKSLAKCRDIGRSWMEFVDDQRFYQDKIKQTIEEKDNYFIEEETEEEVKDLQCMMQR